MEMEPIPIQQQFEEVIASDNLLEVKDFINSQNISDVANLIYENPDYEIQIISTLSIHRAASVFKILDLMEQKRIIKKLPALKSAELLNELSADDRVDFFEELQTGTVRELLKMLDPEERKITLKLMGYPENSVGRLMIPNYIYVYEHNTVQEVFETIRRYGKNTETIDVIYIINDNGELLDDIRIRDFLLAPPQTMVSDLMDYRYISLNAHDDQEMASEVFKMNNRVALPVVDENKILLGIVTIDDILWVAQEEFTEDIQKIGGTEALQAPYLDINLFKLLQKRAGWLIILFIGELFTATVMQYFEHEIEAATVLALFIPLIVSSGGNSGSQASTLIIQAMALGELSIGDWWRVMKREFLTGIMLGAILGITGFLRIIAWQQLGIYDYGPHWFLVALTILFSILGIVLWGCMMGSMLPIILKRFRMDPAASSAPFVATLVDVTGLVIYFSVAYIILHGILL